MLTEDYIKDWPDKRKRLKQKYPQLTENDLGYVVGKEDELYGRIGRRLGTSRKEARSMLREV